MTAIGYPYNLLQGLSDFWQRFFADSPQLESLYRGQAFLLGQAYLDLLENVLSLSLQDCPLLSKEYWRLITIREDQIVFREGLSVDLNRWILTADSDIVGLVTLDNRVIEPTASLQDRLDFTVETDGVEFFADPTNPAGDGMPLAGFARRQLDVTVGGAFDATSRGVQRWGLDLNVQKGDFIRLLHISPAPDFNQSAIGDFRIAVVRDGLLYVASDTALPLGLSTGLSYAILRKTTDSAVSLEQLTFIVGVATLANGRIIKGTLKVYAFVGGLPVVEGVDYTVDYELGKVFKIGVWDAGSSNKADYNWLATVYPAGNGPPHYGIDGIATYPTTVRATEMALWAPDALVDKRLLANNFGSLIGKEAASSDAYRALLRGIFQLYILGPVLERFESALNVILGLPVARDDGEVVVSVDLTNPNFNRVTTTRPAGGEGVYDFPKTAPLRTDLVAGFALQSFEPLSTAVTVTDYVEDPTWWHRIVIPEELFSEAGGAVVPELTRRAVTPLYVENVVNPIDGAKVGDPGLIVGADDEGHLVATGHRIYRHRMSFVLMDRYLKAHMFYVRFSDSVFVDTGVGVKFATDPDELRRLILGAKPAHTFAYAQPATFFQDAVIIADADDRGPWYQPQRFLGADPNASELFATEGDLNIGEPHVLLGLFITPTVNFSDKLLYVDAPPTVGVNGWLVGDYFHYALFTDAMNFAVALETLGHVPGAPRRRRVVRVYIAGTKGGKKLIENTDYTVNYVTGDITRLTVWDANAVNVSFIQLNIGNVVNAPADPTQGDMYLVAAGTDPALVRSGTYDPATGDDMSCVERALTITVS